MFTLFICIFGLNQANCFTSIPSLWWAKLSGFWQCLHIYCTKVEVVLIFSSKSHFFQRLIHELCSYDCTFHLYNDSLIFFYFSLFLNIKLILNNAVTWLLVSLLVCYLDICIVWEKQADDPLFQSATVRSNCICDAEKEAGLFGEWTRWKSIPPTCLLLMSGCWQEVGVDWWLAGSVWRVACSDTVMLLFATFVSVPVV